LREQNVISDFDLKTAYNALMNAKAQVAQAEAHVMDAAEDVEHTRVESPADGVVGVLPYRQGSLVGSTIPQPLTTISDNSSMWVYFSMSEAEFLKMTRNSGSPEKAIEAMPAVRLQLVDGSEYDHLGKIETVSGVIDRNTGSVQLRAVFENPEGLLHSGSTGNVVIPVTYKNALVVPASATVQMQDRFRLYTVDGDGNAKGIIVGVDPLSSGKEFIITDGVEAGTEIVAEGAGMVREGQKVK
jgi:membrane fusion protein (multidrug efflux system)